MQYRLEWDGGPGVVIDLHCVQDVFMLRYDGPLRLTLRRGVEELPITPDDLEERVRGLRNLASSAGLVAARGGAAIAAASDAHARLADEGENLFNLVLPQVVATDLGAESLFVEIGTDEALLPVPWELMRDAVGFIALRHAVGRYVNLKQQLDLNRRLEAQGEVRVLLVSVANPQPVGTTVFERLPEADSEFDAISKLLAERGIDFLPLRGVDATKEQVRKQLHSDRPYTIIHFTGHGHIDPKDARKSGLVLFDGILTTGVISQFLRHAPILAFINGCETAKPNEGAPIVGAVSDGTADSAVTHLTRVFGIARPLLDKGSYVLGTRWRVNDKSAASFATGFYGSLLDGAPIGRAITTARNSAFDEASSDLSWASYVFYGDPRLRIDIEPEVAAEAAAPPSSSSGMAPAAAERRGRKSAAAPSPPPPPNPPSDIPAELAEVARQYEEIRATESDGTRRTLRLEKLLDTVRNVAATTDPSVTRACLNSAEQGIRVVGIVLAKSAPSGAFASDLLRAVRNPLSGFEQYHTLVALQATVEQLNPADARDLRAFLLEILTDEKYLGTDRGYVARETLPRIERHLAQLDQSNPKPEDF